MKSYFFKLYSLESREMIWCYELYCTLQLETNEEFFISFENEVSILMTLKIKKIKTYEDNYELQNYGFGFNFLNVTEAQSFCDGTYKVLKRLKKSKRAGNRLLIIRHVEMTESTPVD
jgi:hypothetical protein